MSNRSSEHDKGSLAYKVNRLFESLTRPDGREYTHEEVAEAIASRGGPSISAPYLWQLRNGKRDNPTKKHLEALADFFEVNPAYFFDEEKARDIDSQLELLAAMRDAGVKDIALRARKLSPEMREFISGVIREAEKTQASMQNKRTGQQGSDDRDNQEGA